MYNVLYIFLHLLFLSISTIFYQINYLSANSIQEYNLSLNSYLSINPFIYTSMHLSIYLSIYLFISPIYISIYPDKTVPLYKIESTFVYAKRERRGLPDISMSRGAAPPLLGIQGVWEAPKRGVQWGEAKGRATLILSKKKCIFATDFHAICNQNEKFVAYSDSLPPHKFTLRGLPSLPSPIAVPRGGNRHLPPPIVQRGGITPPPFTRGSRP